MTMLRSIAVALGVAACLFAFAALGELPGGAIARAMVSVFLGIGVTALIYGDGTFLTVSLGAVSPLALTALERTSVAAATTAMCALWLLPRLALTGTRRRFIVLASISAAAACVAGAIFAAYLDAPLPARAASCVFAGSCLALVGILIPLPTTTSHALGVAAVAIAGPSREALIRAAAAHESFRWQPQARQARRRWADLVRLSDERAALERAVGSGATERRIDVDQRIDTAVAELAPWPAETATPASDNAPIGVDTTAIDAAADTNTNATSTSNATNPAATSTTNATNPTATATSTSNATNPAATSNTNATNPNATSTSTSSTTNPNATSTSSTTNPNATSTSSTTNPNATTTSNATNPAADDAIADDSHEVGIDAQDGPPSDI
jgi:hypothetical protein